MTTVRDARIEAALVALVAVSPEILEADELYRMAVSVVDALFKPDPNIDNVTVPETRRTSNS